MTTVLHVITGLDSGGAERMLTRITLADQPAGDRRHIVVSLMGSGTYGEMLRAGGVELHCLAMRNAWQLPMATLRLAGLIRQCRADVVMTWLYHADLVGTIASAIAGNGTRKVVWNLRCSNMEFGAYASATRWIVRLLARLSRLPAAVAVNSDAGRVHHRSLGYRPRRWVYLPNGFDLDEWRPDSKDGDGVRAELGLDNGQSTVGMVARVDPQKDHATFLAAAERLAALHHSLCFVLIGKGTDRLSIPSRLAGRVCVLGERSDVSRLLRGLDLLVLSSAYGEGFPNVVGEAMATGLPCVVTDVGDAAEIVGDTGLVVPPRTPDALARAISKLLEEPPMVRCRRGEEARRRVTAHYSLDRVLMLYRELWLTIG